MQLLAVVACTACGDAVPASVTYPVVVDSIPTSTAELGAARARWAASRPQKYDYTLAISCFCGPDFRRPVIISVDGAAVTARRYADDGTPAAPQFASSFPTIDGLFDIILDAKARKAASLIVTYDAARGHPLKISVDYVAQVADDELFYTVSGFTPR
jgi:hypothetical protein